MVWLEKLIEPKIQIDESRKIFTNKMLMAMSLPLFGEQLFMMMVGIAATLMVSYAGEEAVSGVSLVTMFITIFLFIFTALTAGGAVIISQYIGKKEIESAKKAAGQLVGIAGVVSIIFLVVVMMFDRLILKALFGSVNDGVMEASITFLRITAFSLPSIAIYNAGSAIFRSMGKTKTIMYISITMNIINVIGNAIGIFILKAGVAGVAWPSLISWTYAALTIMFLCFKRKNEIHLTLKNIFDFDKVMLKRILNIAIPSSFEGGIFQLAKVALGSITAMFGTSQIAANGVAQSFWSMAALVAMAMAPVFITVVGQAMGAQDTEAAQYYMSKLLKMTFVASIAWNGLTLILTPFALNLYDLSQETKSMIIILVIIHNAFNAFIFPVASPFANGLRAAGDVKYTMYVAVFSTIFCRVVLSIILGIGLNLGVIGIALAMGLDWCIRALFFMKRYRGDKWKGYELV